MIITASRFIQKLKLKNYMLNIKNPMPKYFFKRLSIIILAMTVITFWAEQYCLNFMDDSSDESCNVSNVKLQGYLTTYISNEGKDENGIPLWDETSSEDIARAVEEAERDDNIKAIILEIDSHGGEPVAAEEIANALKKANKPTIALIRGYGTSAAYYAAAGADLIFASASSSIGSIGVTTSYLDNTKKNEEDGLTYNQLSAGKFKDTGDYDKSLTPEEKELLMRDVNILHENFIKAVAENRKMDIEKVRELADGSSMPGQMALENNLIDKIGGMDEVKEYLKEKIGGEAEICR